MKRQNANSPEYITWCEIGKQKKKQANPQGPEEMCLSLEHQNPSKTSEKMGYFDRVAVSLHIL